MYLDMPLCVPTKLIHFLRNSFKHVVRSLLFSRKFNFIAIYMIQPVLAVCHASLCSASVGVGVQCKMKGAVSLSSNKKSEGAGSLFSLARQPLFYFILLYQDTIVVQLVFALQKYCPPSLCYIGAETVQSILK